MLQNGKPKNLLNIMDISKYIDYTLLKATTTEREIIDLCHDAKQHDFYSVCINPAYVALANQILENTNVKICTVVGFPLGASSTATKVYEAKNAIEDGADEIEMVMNLGFLKSKKTRAYNEPFFQVQKRQFSL